MMIDAKEKTALNTSVGADERQSFQTIPANSILTSESEINDQIKNSEESFEEMCRRMQRLTDPHYLHTITMTEFFQTTYKSRPPTRADRRSLTACSTPGLIFWLVRQKSASPFWWHRLPIISAPGRNCGSTKFIRERCYTSLWRMTINESRVGCL